MHELKDIIAAVEIVHRLVLDALNNGNGFAYRLLDRVRTHLEADMDRYFALPIEPAV